MQSFLDKHAAKISGVISCFDRMLLRGYLPLMSGYAMAQFLCQQQILYNDLKSFLISNAAALKEHAVDLARTAARPYSYLASSGVRKEQRASAIAAEDGIEEGLVCIFAQLEPCNTFSFRRLHPMRQCVGVDRGRRTGPAVCRSPGIGQLAARAQSLRASDQPPPGQAVGTDGVLLGHRAVRVGHGCDVP
jgi:hypothetical protein